MIHPAQSDFAIGACDEQCSLRDAVRDPASLVANRAFAQFRAQAGLPSYGGQAYATRRRPRLISARKRDISTD
jgi:hypothetical protein